MSHRPSWLLLVMALPLGITLNFISSWSFNQGSERLLVLWATQWESTRFQEALVGLTVCVVLTTLLVFCLLKFTRLGSWLAPNRLALGLVLLFDAVVVLMGVRRLYLVGLGEWDLSYLQSVIQNIVNAAVAECLIGGLTLLALSTLWNRMNWSGKQRAVRLTKWLWREV